MWIDELNTASMVLISMYKLYEYWNAAKCNVTFTKYSLSERRFIIVDNPDFNWENRVENAPTSVKNAQVKPR